MLRGRILLRGKILAAQNGWPFVSEHIERDIIQLGLCHDIISTNHNTDNMWRPNQIMSRYNFNQSHHR